MVFPGRMSLFGLVSPLLAAPLGCDVPVDTAAWSSILERAERAYAATNAGLFDAAMAEAALVLPCVGVPLTPPGSARYHRLVALRRYAAGDEAAASLALLAAKTADPYGGLSPALVPTGHAIWQLATRDPPPASTARLRRAGPRSVLYCDGLMSRRRPLDRPTVYQVEVDGELVLTAYLTPERPTPRFQRAQIRAFRRAGNASTSAQEPG